VLIIGEICAVLGIAATLVLASRWAKRASQPTWPLRLRVAFGIAAPQAVGMVLFTLGVASSGLGLLGGWQLVAACLGWCLVVYLMTALAYLPFFELIASLRRRRPQE